MAAVTGDRAGILLVDDEAENVGILSDILADAGFGPVRVARSVTEAVAALHERAWALVIMDVFIPLGDHPQRVLGPRAARLQATVEHLGGLVLLDEIDRMDAPPRVVAHTACTERPLLEVLDGRVAARLRKGAPLDTVLRDVLDVLAGR